MDLLEKYEIRLHQLDKGGKEIYEGEREAVKDVIESMTMDLIADTLEGGL